jgi:hypothetical protein
MGDRHRKVSVFGRNVLARLAGSCTIDSQRRLQQDRHAKGTRRGQAEPRAGRDGIVEGIHESNRAFVFLISAHPTRERAAIAARRRSRDSTVPNGLFG